MVCRKSQASVAWSWQLAPSRPYIIKRPRSHWLGDLAVGQGMHKDTSNVEFEVRRTKSCGSLDKHEAR